MLLIALAPDIKIIILHLLLVVIIIKELVEGFKEFSALVHRMMILLMLDVLTDLAHKSSAVYGSYSLIPFQERSC